MISKVTTVGTSQTLEQAQVIKESLTTRVFDIFRRIAENPIEEIGGRTIWSDHKGDLSNCNSINLVEITRCTTTVQALLVALFGPETAYQIMGLWRSSDAQKQPQDPLSLKQTYGYIEKNGDSIRNNTATSFAYIFGLFRNPKPSTPQASSHLFLVIQYADHEEKVRYRLFQSFLEYFDLKKDIDQESNFFSQTQFESFFSSFEQFFLLSDWTQELKQFYQQFFHVESSLKIGEPNPYFGTGPLIRSKSFTFENVEKNDREFTNLKQTALFKKIMSKVIQ